MWLATPTMHDEELKYMTEAYRTNWMSTVGENINEVERLAAEQAGVKYAVGLSCCTAALHLCCKLAGEKLYGRPAISHGALEGRRVFCSDMTFDATLNPVVYEGGIPVFIDTEESSWNMDPVALEKAFDLYPEVKLVVAAELYGFPGRMDEIKRICEKHGALLIEDAAEAMGAYIDGKPCGSFGDYSAVSYNGNKILEVGAPKEVIFFDAETINKRRELLRKSLMIEADDYIVLYAPTFREGNRIDAYQLNFNSILKTFERKLKKKCRIIIRLHPNVRELCSFIEYNSKIINGSMVSDFVDGKEVQIKYRT